jgi:hypothetical protein
MCRESTKPLIIFIKWETGEIPPMLVRMISLQKWKADMRKFIRASMEFCGNAKGCRKRKS